MYLAHVLTIDLGGRGGNNGPMLSFHDVIVVYASRLRPCNPHMPPEEKERVGIQCGRSNGEEKQLTAARAMNPTHKQNAPQ